MISDDLLITRNLEHLWILETRRRGWCRSRRRRRRGEGQGESEGDSEVADGAASDESPP